jgi:hypothetical protein
MSLLAELRNKKQARAIAIPAIPAIRTVETGGGIARIAQIAVATEIIQKVESANDVDFMALPLPILDGEQQPLATAKAAIPAIPAIREQPLEGDCEHVAIGGTSCVFRTDDAVGIFPEIGEKSGSFHRACAFEDALQALAACGWHGAGAEAVAAAIADGVTDEVVLTAMLEVRHV